MGVVAYCWFNIILQQEASGICHNFSNYIRTPHIRTLVIRIGLALGVNLSRILQN